MKKIILKVIFIFTIFFSCSCGVLAETVRLMECEYTDAYKKWLKLTEEEKKNTIEPAKCKTNNNFYSLIGNSSVVESYTSTKFDLRKYNAVSSMKDQANTNLCWTFATMESIQSNVSLKKNINIDLSESHLELATQNNLFESLMPFSRNFNTGGNYFMSAAYLMDRVGPVLESSVPFNVVSDVVDKKTSVSLANISNKKVELAVNDVTFNLADVGSCSNDSITAIKKYLVSNGAMSTSVYFDIFTQDSKLENGKVTGKFINGEYYYYDGSAYITIDDKSVSANQSVNHGVTIIGWDDTISKDNFSVKPSRDGAWLIKNSYGERLNIDDTNYIDMGSNGYYYISYDDINVCTFVAGYYNIDNNVEDKVYSYDKLGAVPAVEFVKDIAIYLANVFNREVTTPEMLEKISFYNFNVGQSYELLYGTTFDNMQVIYQGVVDHSGVTTVKIDPINITTDNFIVGIKINGKTNDIIPSYNKLIGSAFLMDVPENVSYISVDGKAWENYSISGQNFLLPLKVYTSNANYTFSFDSYEINDDMIQVKLDYDGIDNLDDITYNIYDKNDVELANPLNDKFLIDNKISTDKVLKISMSDNSTVGGYSVVVTYKNTKLINDFSVVEGEDGELVFSGFVEPDNSDKEEVPDFVVDSNPNNSDVNNTPVVEENIKENPKTGMTKVSMVGIILLLSLVAFVIYSLYNFKKNND